MVSAVFRGVQLIVSCKEEERSFGEQVQQMAELASRSPQSDPGLTENLRYGPRHDRPADDGEGFFIQSARSRPERAANDDSSDQPLPVTRRSAPLGCRPGPVSHEDFLIDEIHLELLIPRSTGASGQSQVPAAPLCFTAPGREPLPAHGRLGKSGRRTSAAHGQGYAGDGLAEIAPWTASSASRRRWLATGPEERSPRRRGRSAFGATHMRTSTERLAPLFWHTEPPCGVLSRSHSLSTIRGPLLSAPRHHFFFLFSTSCRPLVSPSNW